MMTNSQSASAPGAPGPADVPAPSEASAGVPVGEVEAVVRVLDGLDSMPTALHVAAFERVHTALTEALSTIDGV